MIRIHHLERSRSKRLVWLLEELDVSYEIVEYARNPITQRAPASLRKLHPLGKAPMLEDDGLVLAETAAIFEYILDTYGEGRLAPERDDATYRTYRFFMHYAEGSLMPPLVLRFIFDMVLGAKMPFFIKPVARGIVGKVNAAFVDVELANHGAFLASALEAGGYLLGEEFSAADILMSFPIESLIGRADLAPSQRAPLVDYIERIRARDSYRRIAGLS